MKNRYRIVVLFCFLSFFLQAQWEHIATPQFNDPSGFCDCWYKGAIASNSTYYWAYDVACGQGGSFYSYFKIFRTTDSGINWDLKVTESYTSASLNSMKFISADTGFINRNDMTLSMIERTADGMNSFSNCSYSSFHAFGDLAMINFNNIYALNGNDKSLEHLENNTFNVVYNFPQSIYFGNYTEIEAPGNQFLFLACLTSPYLPQPNNLILKSNDGGNSWDTSYLASTNSINEICFCNDSIGFAACTEGIILKTEDAGLSWSNKNSGVSANLGAIDYLNDSTWIIAGSLGTIIITYDGGET